MCTRNTKGVFGTVPVFSVPVWMSYLTCRSIRYRYGCRTEVTEVPGTGIDVVPEVTEVSGTGIDVVPKLPKCRAPVLM